MIERHRAWLEVVRVDDPGIFFDIDTPGDLPAASVAGVERRIPGQPARRGGYFSPASTRTLRMFCFGGSGQVVNSLKAQGGL